jgi:hypothetical protein
MSLLGATDSNTATTFCSARSVLTSVLFSVKYTKWRSDYESYFKAAEGSGKIIINVS